MLIKGVNDKNKGLFLGKIRAYYPDATWEKVPTTTGNTKYNVLLPSIRDLIITLEIVSIGVIVTIPMDGIYYNKKDVMQLEKNLGLRIKKVRK